MDENPVNENLCPLGAHGKVCSDVGHLEEKVKRACKTHDSLWAGLKTKVAWVVFLPAITLVLVIIGILFTSGQGFRTTMLSEMSAIKTTTAVISNDLAHLKAEIAGHVQLDEGGKGEWERR